MVTESTAGTARATIRGQDRIVWIPRDGGSAGGEPVDQVNVLPGG